MKNRLSRPAIGSVSRVPSQVTKVGVHSWAVLGRGEDVLHSYGANQGFIVGKRASLVVDTGLPAKVAASIIRRVNSKTRRISVLNTHYQSDHVFGNSVFADTKAVIIANQNCSRSMKVKSEKLLDGYRKRDPGLSSMLRGVGSPILISRLRAKSGRNWMICWRPRSSIPRRGPTLMATRSYSCLETGFCLREIFSGWVIIRTWRMQTSRVRFEP